MPWAISWVLPAAGRPAPTSRNCRRPAWSAKYRTTRAWNAPANKADRGARSARSGPTSSGVLSPALSGDWLLAGGRQAGGENDARVSPGAGEADRIAPAVGGDPDRASGGERLDHQ